MYQTYLSVYPGYYHPPSKLLISKFEAISIVLEYGEWNETTLKGYAVIATLYYVKFFKDNGTDSRFCTRPLSQYQITAKCTLVASSTDDSTRKSH